MGGRRGGGGALREAPPAHPARLTPVRASRERLERHVRALEGVRHPRHDPAAHSRAADYVGDVLHDAGLRPFVHPFRFRGREHWNVAAVKGGRDPDAPRVLIGAHYDTVRKSPGADDNASGVALVLEAARLLAALPLEASVEFVAFDLEEFQWTTYRVGSRRWVARSLERGVRYRAALVLEMVGYADHAPGSQRIPLPLRWKDVPDRGNFIAAIGDGKSRHLLPIFTDAARRATPELPVVTLRSPARGWVLWNTRRSDNASFWSSGQPALMITNTAFLRNPNYHRPTDTADTLDYGFLERVTGATTEAVRLLAGVGRG